MAPNPENHYSWSDLFDHIHTMSPSAQQRLVKLLLTAEEQKIILNRLAITRDLLLGHNTQRSIAKQLGVSIATITRGSNALKALSFEDYELVKNTLISIDSK